MEVYIIVAFVVGPCQRSMHAIRGANLPLPLRFPAGPAERTHENALALERNLLSKLETTILYSEQVKDLNILSCWPKGKLYGAVRE